MGDGGGSVALSSRDAVVVALARSTKGGVPVGVVLEAGVGGEGWPRRAIWHGRGIIKGRTATHREADASGNLDPWVLGGSRRHPLPLPLPCWRAPQGENPLLVPPTTEKCKRDTALPLTVAQDDGGFAALDPYGGRPHLSASGAPPCRGPPPVFRTRGATMGESPAWPPANPSPLAVWVWPARAPDAPRPRAACGLFFPCRRVTQVGWCPRPLVGSRTRVG